MNVAKNRITNFSAVLLLVVLCFAFASCGNNEDFLESNLNQNMHSTQSQTRDKNIEEDLTMTTLEKALYDKVKTEILKWNEDDIYAISFFIDSNEENRYKNYSNVSMWAISYNAEKDCDGAGELDEERWNYAFWRQNETPIIDIDSPNKYTEMLFDWYAENGIKNIGEENEDEMYDEDGNFVGKGPVGHYELLQIASDVARKLQEDGVIKEHFEKELPIIIHGLEYAWYDVEATKNANPNGEADTFLEAMEDLGFC